jgi:hypothetical protein
VAGRGHAPPPQFHLQSYVLGLWCGERKKEEEGKDKGVFVGSVLREEG